MTRDIEEPRAAKARLSAVAGRLTLTGTGLGALALVAVAASMVIDGPVRLAEQSPVAARGPAGDGAMGDGAMGIGPEPFAGTDAMVPRVWMAAFDLRDTPFAAPDLSTDPVITRRAAPSAAPATRLVEPAAVPVPAPVAVAEPAPGPDAPAAAPQHVEVRPHAPRAVPPRRPAVSLPVAGPEIASLDIDPPDTIIPNIIAAPNLNPQADLAIRRSPLPPQRPVLARSAPDAAPEIARPETAAPDPQQFLLASLGDSTGLLRSRTPQARPETVTRLASLAPAPQAPVAAVEVPALTTAIARGSDSCDSQLTRAIPGRARSASDGSTVIGRLTGTGGRDRDDAILAEVLAGNVPDFQRNLVPVTFSGNADNGQPTRITVCVTPDYLAVGSNRDFVRVPLGLPAAMRVAERFDMILPTTRMVDAIYSQAQVRLSPSPMDPTSAMVTTNYFLRHNATVQGQMARAGGQLGQLVSGHKKDLVLSNRLQSNPGRVAIYGWHQRNGQAIQPLSTVHGAQYADYSHGVRLVARRAFVNGRAVDLRDLLSDGRLAGLVSSEGTITNRQLLALAD